MDRNDNEIDMEKNVLYASIAGVVETLVCQPLDTMKIYLQQKSNNTSSVISRIYHKQGWTGFYRGLGPMLISIPLKNAFRFGMFEFLREKTNGNLMISGLLTGAFEFILVNPLDICRIRLQSQYHSTWEGRVIHRNMYSVFKHILVTEGIQQLYKGSSMTIIRQSINQGSNFYVFYKLKERFPDCPHFILGFISGSIGPFLNNPIDVIKTRCQRTHDASLKTAFQSIHHLKELYSGLGARLLRIAPGQAITFSVYEFLHSL